MSVPCLFVSKKTQSNYFFPSNIIFESGEGMSDFDGLCGNADNLLDENYSFEHAFEAEIPLSETLVMQNLP
jgi:hypothetical protein